MIARFEALAREGRGNAPSAAASTSPPAPRVSCVYFSLFGSRLGDWNSTYIGLSISDPLDPARKTRSAVLSGQQFSAVRRQ